MLSAFEWMIAGRYLRARKAEGFVSVIAAFSFLGIMLGVATLIIVMSVMNGFRKELITRVLGLNGHMNVYASAGPLYEYQDLAGRIRQVPGVSRVFPILESQVLLSVQGHSSGALVRGIAPDDFTAKPVLSSSVVRGSLADFSGNRIAIGIELAKKFHLEIGDSITLIAPKGRPGPFGTLPRSRSYQIAVIFDVEMYEYNNGFIFMPLEAAQLFLQMKDAVSSLEVFTDNPADMALVRTRVTQVVEGRGGVYDWRDSNGSFFDALEVERNVMFLILTLIILVAAFNIISSMIMLVRDKGGDIAILRTMGATRGAMMRIFMMVGASIGFLGTLAGAMLGIAFALNIESIRHVLEHFTGMNLFNAEIRFLYRIPADIDWHETGAVILVAFVLSFLATLYPAWRAARIDPAEALRYE